MRFSIGGNSHNEKKQEADLKPVSREFYNELEDNVGYHFEDISHLQRALTHRSVPAIHGSHIDYERLEFLGDAVLDLIVADLLLAAHQDVKEGELSKMRAALVNTTSLANVARSINLGKYIRLSRGESAAGGADRSSILADVFEATMGAIYREAGYSKVFEVVKNLFEPLITTVVPNDPKTELQEALHAAGSGAPVYLLECVEGPKHAPNFVSVVEVDGQIVGRGQGATKKASQQAAAAEALERLLKSDEIDNVFFTLEKPATGDEE